MLCYCLSILSICSYFSFLEIAFVICFIGRVRHISVTLHPNSRLSSFLLHLILQKDCFRRAWAFKEQVINVCLRTSLVVLLVQAGRWLIGRWNQLHRIVIVPILLAHLVFNYFSIEFMLSLRTTRIGYYMTSSWSHVIFFKTYHLRLDMSLIAHVRRLIWIRKTNLMS